MRPDPTDSQPIVILGGFLSFAMLYCGMQDCLTGLTGQPVSIVETYSLDWAAVVAIPGWNRVLRKLDDTVQAFVHQSPTGKVTLVGHSAGGVLARLYLSPKPFWGRVYGGLNYVDQLITLGSPHYSERKWLHGGMMAQWMERRYPGAFFAPQVQYTAVAGKLIRGDRQGTLRERHAHVFYEDALGDGDVWGDGLVPIASALLEGSRPIVLEDVAHFAGFGGPWYGAPEVIPRWWYGRDGERDQ